MMIPGPTRRGSPAARRSWARILVGASLVTALAAFGAHSYRVTKVIGGRYREDFAGVELASGAPASALNPRAEMILPVSFVFETRSFRLKGYSVMVGERPGLQAGAVWNETCVFC